MPREPFVHERIVGVQKGDDTAIFANRAPDKQLRLALESLQQTEVVVGIPLRIDDDFVDTAQVQPLCGEIVDERFAGARVGQHPPDFLVQR
jgi:hypothetical protein